MLERIQVNISGAQISSMLILTSVGNTAFVVGEKAADIIIKELGLEKSQPRL
jgi:hypothetical protein